MPGGKNQITGKDGKLFTATDARINRLGRPKKMNLERLLKKVLLEKIDDRKALEGILIKLRDMALAGNIRAAELLLDRCFGKAKATNELTRPIVITAIQYILPDGNQVKADAEATFSLGSPKGE
jgi:hypothetical protein